MRLSRRLLAAFSWVALNPQARVERIVRTITLAFGPQHPAAHGILKLAIQAQGEVLQRVDPQFGFLHRGTEKLIENRNFLQALPYFDRFDYVANLTQEHAYCLAVEALQAQAAFVALPTLLARTLFDELSRVLNHLLTLSATSLDLSAMGPIFWAFEERENAMALLEQASGARMHTSLYRPFFFDSSVFTQVFFRDLTYFLSRCGRSLNGAFAGLLNNRGLKSRLAGVGQLSPAKLGAYGITGLIARSAGVLSDCRMRGTPGYGVYGALTWRAFLGRRGDNLDRFLARIKETVESFRVLSQVIQACRAGALALPASAQRRQLSLALAWPKPHAFYPASRRLCRASLSALGAPASAATPLASPRLLGLGAGSLRGREKFVSMEALIAHFRESSEGYPAKAGLTYQSVESPKGEVGVTALSGGSARPQRLKLRTPVAHNMHLIPSLVVGAFFADFVASFCSLDIVLGEIDR